MCGNTKTTTSGTTTGAVNSTTTPNVPQWLQTPYQGVAGQVGNLMTANPATFVPAASASQTAAFDGGANLSTDPMGAFSAASRAAGTGIAPVAAQGYQPATVGQASTYTAAQAAPASLLDDLAAHMNPFTSDVVKTSLADFDQSAGQQRAADDLQAAKNSALGGSGFAIQKSLTDGELARARATTDAGLRSDAFNTGASLSNEDAARREEASLANAGAQNTAGAFNAGAQNTVSAQDQAAKNSAWSQNATAANTVAGQNADRALTGASTLDAIGTTAGANDRSNLSTLDTLGQDQRAVTKDQAQAPLSVLQQLQQVLSGIPTGDFTGSTTNGTSSGTSSGTSTQTANTMDQLIKILGMFTGGGGSGGGGAGPAGAAAPGA